MLCESIPYLESAISEFEELRSEFPRISRYGDGLGTAISGLGQAELSTNSSPDVSIKLLDRSDAVFSSLASADSSPAYFIAKIATVRGQLAQAFQRSGDLSKARRNFTDSESLFQDLLEPDDTNSDYRYALAEVEWRRGLLEREDGDFVEANKRIASAADRMRKLAQEHLENAQYHYRLGEILLHEPDVTMEISREADKHLQTAMELQPTNFNFRSLWAEVKVRLGEVELATKLLGDNFSIRGSRSAQDLGVLALLDCRSRDREGAAANLFRCRELVTAQQPFDSDLNRWMLSIQRSIDEVP